MIGRARHLRHAFHRHIAELEETKLPLEATSEELRPPWPGAPPRPSWSSGWPGAWRRWRPAIWAIAWRTEVDTLVGGVSGRVQARSGGLA